MHLLANIGINWWDGSGTSERGLKLIDAAKISGAHGVVVPCLKANKLFRPENLIESTKKFDMNMDFVRDWKQIAAEKNLTFIVAPRYAEAVEQLEQIGVDAYHVNNGDINFTPLLKEIKKTGKAVHISTGMASEEEIGAALDAVSPDDVPEEKIFILHSTGAMPTPAQDAQLGRILDLAQRFFPFYVGYESFSSNLLLDYISMAYRPYAIMRRIDLGDRAGVEMEYSLSPSDFTQLSKIAMAMHQVNNPILYHDGFTESDFDARIKQMRCAETEYLLPPEN